MKIKINKDTTIRLINSSNESFGLGQRLKKDEIIEVKKITKNAIYNGNNSYFELEPSNYEIL